MTTNASINDLKAICKGLAEKTALDVELKKRAIEEADCLREEQRRKHGFVTAAVELIREGRGK